MEDQKPADTINAKEGTSIGNTTNATEITEDKNKTEESPKRGNKRKSPSPDPVTDTSSDSSLGKGKRARIPNKRYSDIDLSKSSPVSVKSAPEIANEKPKSESSGSGVEERSKSPFPKRSKIQTLDLKNNPNFLKPLNVGWKRELVRRSVNVLDSSGRRPSDIYYFAPDGKKLRSMREIADYLVHHAHQPGTKGLETTDFTFLKESMDLDDPNKEIIRDAKLKSGPVVPATANKRLSAASASKPPKPTQSPTVEEKISSQEEEIPTNTTKDETEVVKQEEPREELKTEPEPPKQPKGSPLKVKLSTRSKPEKKNNIVVKKDRTRRKATTVTSNSVDSTTNAAATRKSARMSSQSLVTSESATVNNVGNTNTTTGRKRNSVVNSNTTNRRLSSENQSTTSTITSHQQKNKESRLKNNHNEGDTNENANFLQLVSFGYDSLLYIFQYLKVQDLLRAGRVCSMWRDLASHPRLWRTVRMKNSHVRSFEGMAEALRKHSTVQLDLRKMLLTTNSSNNNNNNGGGGGGAGVTAASNTDEMWPEFSSNIGKVETLRKIELCRCPSSVIENLALTNPHLEIVNAVMIRSDQIDLANLSNWTGLRELRLKATPFFSLGSTGIDPLRGLRHLRHLSLTSIRDLNRTDLTVIAELTELESLDLGECVDFPAHFGPVVLSKLKKLEKLRIEKGQGDCHPFDMLRAVQKMEKLEQLELVNFDVKPGFDKALGACKNLKKLLMIPTYISQSATTSHMVLAGVLRLRRSLTHFVWGVTLELLRVTELFVDQCDDEEKKDKKQIIGMGDSIPVLKPVPLLTTSSEEWKNKAVEEMEREEEELPAAFDPPQVEILALPGLQKLLLQCLPDTRVKILKIPFHATWRQSINDAVN